MENVNTAAAPATATPATVAPTPTPAPTPAPKAPAKRKAPKAKATPAAPTVGGVALPLPTGPLYTVGKLPPVGPATHRAFAQATATTLAKAMPKGFALNQYRAALVGNVLPTAHPQRNVAAPTHGWAKHNMPTWCAGQGWLVPVA